MSFAKEVLTVSFGELMEFVKRHYFVASSVAIVGVSMYSLQQLLAGKTCASTAQLHGKTVIVTGANNGIGLETARDLAHRGAKVILACRDKTKADIAATEIRETTGNNNVVVQLVDLASLTSVRRFAESIIKTEKKLHILINNAAVICAPGTMSQDGYEMHWAVNHLSHFLLTNLLLDLLKESAPSRIINMSSLAHEYGKIEFDDINLEKEQKNRWAGYCQSKLANVLFTHELHKRLEGTGVSCFSLHPGGVKTEIMRHSSLLMHPLQSLMFKVISLVFFKTPYQGAQTSIYCAVQEGLEDQSGKYFSECQVQRASSQAEDDDIASRLWEVSSRMVGLQERGLRTSESTDPESGSQ